MTTGQRFAAWAAIAGALAVLFAGLVAIVVVDRTLDTMVDRRLATNIEQVRSTREQARQCEVVRSAGAASLDDRMLALVSNRGEEICRSSTSAPSPRALGVTEPTDGLTRVVDGIHWRARSDRDQSGNLVIAAEAIEAARRSRSDARTAIIAAMAIGVLLALAAGALAAIPARRRIQKLLDRIATASRDRSGGAIVGRIGSRDLDAAAQEIDELLGDVRASDAAQRRLVSDAAHQLRTPITSLRANAQLLERQQGLDADARDLATRIARQSSAMADLITDVVDVAAAPAWAGERVDTQLGDVVQIAIHRASGRWPDARFERAGDDGSAAIVDVDLAARAIGNLLDNAIVHGGGEHVRIEVRDGIVRVSDDGPGFTIDLDDAFRPFSSGGSGSGLGLAFVQHVARAHGGDAWIDGDEPAAVAVRFGAT